MSEEKQLYPWPVITDAFVNVDLPLNTAYQCDYTLTDVNNAIKPGEVNQKVQTNINALRGAVDMMEFRIQQLSTVCNHLIQENEKLKSLIPGPKRELNYGR